MEAKRRRGLADVKQKAEAKADKGAVRAAEWSTSFTSSKKA